MNMKLKKMTAALALTITFAPYTAMAYDSQTFYFNSALFTVEYQLAQQNMMSNLKKFSENQLSRVITKSLRRIEKLETQLPKLNEDKLARLTVKLDSFNKVPVEASVEATEQDDLMSDTDLSIAAIDETNTENKIANDVVRSPVMVASAAAGTRAQASVSAKLEQAKLKFQSLDQKIKDKNAIDWGYVRETVVFYLGIIIAVSFFVIGIITLGWFWGILSGLGGTLLTAIIVGAINGRDN